MQKKLVGPLAFAAFAIAAIAAPGTASALTVGATVLGTANPWDISNPDNPQFSNNKYNTGPGTGPTVVTNGFDFSAGNQFVITASGSINVGGGQPDNGPAGIPTFSYGPNAGVPSDYTSGPYFVGELIGTFANASGTVVGSPFVVGNGGSFTAPSDASELLFGINDTSFGDNTGSFSLVITGTAVNAVPLPASAPMLGAALLALGAAGYGLKRRKAAA